MCCFWWGGGEGRGWRWVCCGGGFLLFHDLSVGAEVEDGFDFVGGLQPGLGGGVGF